MSERFGIKGQALNWVEHEVDCNVPLGSLLGPSMFGVYNSLVEDIFKWHGVLFHFYADEIQIYVLFSIVEEAGAPPKRLKLCIHDVWIWMVQNYLNLNNDKTDYMILGSKNSLQKVSAIPITNCD